MLVKPDNYHFVAKGFPHEPERTPIIHGFPRTQPDILDVPVCKAAGDRVIHLLCSQLSDMPRVSRNGCQKDNQETKIWKFGA